MGDDNNDSSSDADLTYHSDNDGYPVNVKDHGQQTPPSSPPQPLPPVLAPKRFSKPEPADTSRLGIRAREQAFLMKKKDQQAKHPTNQQGSAETPKGIALTISSWLPLPRTPSTLVLQEQSRDRLITSRFS